MATRIGPGGVCEVETNTYDKDGTSASIIDTINCRRETLFFRGITAGNGITVDLVDVPYPNGLGYTIGKTIQISSTGGGSASDVKVEDAGSAGTSIIGTNGVENNTIPFRTIEAGSGLTVTEENDIITISAVSGLGAKWFVITTTTPDNSVGNDGDMLVNSNGEIYSKISGTWTDSTVNIKGTDGLGITNRGNFATGVQYNVNDLIINPVNGSYGGSVFIVTKAFDSTSISLSDAEQAGDVELLVENGQRGTFWFEGPGTDNASIVSYAEANSTTTLTAIPGDLYLSSDNYTVFELSSTAGQWESTGIVLKGIQGIQGPIGQKGDTGTGLTNQGSWKSGTTYNPGDYVFAPTSDGATTTSMFVYEGSSSFVSTTAPADDTANWVEFTAPAGQRGSLWTVSSDNSAPTTIANSEVNDVYLAGDGKVYSLTSIASNGTQTWSSTGLNLTGPVGATGAAGTNGTNGVSPTVTVGTTTTGTPGSSASVTENSSSTATNTILDFTIPTGTAGTNGIDGTKWFYNGSATDGSSLKSEGGKVGDLCLIGTGEIYSLASIDASNNETWNDTGLNIKGPTGATGATGEAGATGATGEAGPTGQTGATGQRGTEWFIGTISSPTNSTIPTDTTAFHGVTPISGDVYLGTNNYVYSYNGSAWSQTSVYIGSSEIGTTVTFDNTSTALGNVSNNNAIVYSLAGGTGITLSEASNVVTISTTGSSISALVGSTQTTGITTLVEGSNVVFDTSTVGSLKISSTGTGGSSSLSTLSDVSITNPLTGNILQYNSGSSKWVAVAPSFALSSNISDVGITTPSNGQILQYNATDSKWENTTLSVPVDNISGTLYVSKGGTGQTSFTANGVLIGNGSNAIDVTSAPTENGQVLTWDGTGYEWNIPSGGGATNSLTYAIALGYGSDSNGGATAMALPAGWTTTSTVSSSSPQTSVTITTDLPTNSVVSWMTVAETNTSATFYSGDFTRTGTSITLNISSGTTGANNVNGTCWIIISVATNLPVIS